jgi:hypothetical protein
MRFMSDLVEQRDVPEAVRREVERVVSYGTVTEARTLIEHLTGLPRLENSVASVHQRRITNRTDRAGGSECPVDQQVVSRHQQVDHLRREGISSDELQRLFDGL